jgi:L-ribulose-5-phosphate 3-epimerase UlaE
LHLKKWYCHTSFTGAQMTQITLPDETVELDKLLEEVSRLAQARELLDEIWTHFGPYGTGEPMPVQLISKLQRYFRFDDSE